MGCNGLAATAIFRAYWNQNVTLWPARSLAQLARFTVALACHSRCDGAPCARQGREPGQRAHIHPLNRCSRLALVLRVATGHDGRHGILSGWPASERAHRAAGGACVAGERGCWIVSPRACACVRAIREARMARSDSHGDRAHTAMDKPKTLWHIVQPCNSSFFVNKTATKHEQAGAGAVLPRCCTLTRSE